MTKTEQYEFKCNHCGHSAHCGHSCVDDSCDHCTECGCVHCQAANFNATEQEKIERGYN